MKLQIITDENEYPSVIKIASAVIDYFVDNNQRLDGFDELKEFNEHISTFIKHNRE